MSIIHDALKRHDEEKRGEPTDAAPSPPATKSGGDSLLWPAVLSAGGVLLAAGITYVALKPASIRVVVPRGAAVPTSVAPAASPLAQAATPVPVKMNGAPDPILDPEIPLPEIPPVTVTTTVAPRPAGQVGLAPLRLPAAPAPPAATPVTTPKLRISSNITNAGAPSSNDLPADAVTIEIAEGRLESLYGAASVNGTVPAPGSSVRVGSELATGAAGGISLGFGRANIDLGANSQAKVSRLERHSLPTGGSAEEVTVHLKRGEARAVVRPGLGSVLISTDQVTTSAASGAFLVKTNADQSVTVSSTGGRVRIVSRANQNEVVTLDANESVTYRNGEWIRP